MLLLLLATSRLLDTDVIVRVFRHPERPPMRPLRRTFRRPLLASVRLLVVVVVVTRVVVATFRSRARVVDARHRLSRGLDERTRRHWTDWNRDVVDLQIFLKIKMNLKIIPRKTKIYYLYN